MFEEQEYENQVFTGITAIGFDLSYKSFTDCRFENCNFTEALFRGAALEDCVFSGCNLSLSLYDEARLRNIVYNSCKLVGVNYVPCDRFIVELHYTECLLQNCNFSELDLKKSLFRDCKIIETDFISSNLQEADFSGSLLSGSLFNGTNLSKADFTGAREYTISPVNNNIKKAKFSLPEAVSLLKDFDIKIQ